MNSQADDAMNPEPPRRPVTRGVILAYLACFVAAYLIPGFIVRHKVDPKLEAEHPHKFTSLASKVEFYRLHAPEYDLAFVGDSRTYCDVSPDEIDVRLGSHSINLGMWANWFLSQYPSLEDLVPSIPSHTVLVWSIGRSNFEAKPDSLAYPIGARNAFQYLRWGYPAPEVIDNVVGLLPGLDVYAGRGTIHGKINGVLSVPVVGGPAQPNSAMRNVEQLAALQQQYAQDPRVLSIEPVEADGEFTSAALHMNRGNYVRVEFDHDYFRRKQAEYSANLQPIGGDTYQPYEPRWLNFVAILDMLVARGVRLVVNEVEEAPYNFTSDNEKRMLRAFMRRVQGEVERRGVPYVRVDWDEFADGDYFDWNHLNSDGVVKYADHVAPLLASAIRK